MRLTLVPKNTAVSVCVSVWFSHRAVRRSHSRLDVDLLAEGLMVMMRQNGNKRGTNYDQVHVCFVGRAQSLHQL